MNVLLLAFGSRGDVQPVLALARGLLDAGYQVRIGASADFQEWIEGAGFAYERFHADAQAMMQSEEGKRWIEESSRNPAAGIQFMRQMMDAVGGDVNADLLRMSADADVIVSGLPTFAVAEAVCAAQHKRHIRMMFVPMKPSADPTVTLVPWWPRGRSPLNRWAAYLTLVFLWNVNKNVTNTLRAQLNLPPWNYGDYARAWNHTPTLYGLSQITTPPADDWPGHNAVTGYWFYDDPGAWEPPDALREFIDGGAPPVYIGFGSMASSDPSGVLRIALAALQASGQRGIIYRGWAEIAADDLPDDVFLLDGAPHDWLFPQCAAVVHHGGAGTTGAALRAGVPMTIVAHMADQPYWGRRTTELGVAPTFIPRHKLSAKTLTDALRAMRSDPALPQRAADLAAQIRGESGVQNAVAAFWAMVR